MTKKPLPESNSTRGRFGPGNPGRPKGATNKKTALTTAAADVLTGDDYREIVLKMAELAKQGDAAAAKLILPRWKTVVKPVRFDMDVEDPVQACKDVATAISRGEVPPDVGAMIISSLSDLANVTDVYELRAMLQEWKEAKERERR